jgi:parvulin-like peptidyl-prolyl isomerase
MQQTLIKKFISEPLVHFLVIALVFFVVYDLINPTPLDDDKIIKVSNNRIEQLKTGFEKTWTRKPTAQELDKMVESYALDEIYAREAKALGLDENDGVIKRRLRQKMEFILQDLSALKAPSDNELTTYLQNNKKKYQQDNIYSFEQVYLMTNRTEQEIEQLVKKQQQRIKQGQKPLGDSSMLPTSIVGAITYQVNRQFGQEFNRFLDKSPLNQWTGPVKSGLGLHFIKVSARTAGQVPALTSIKNQLIKDWHYQQNQEFKESYQQKLLEQYQIKINKPLENQG